MGNEQEQVVVDRVKRNSDALRQLTNEICAALENQERELELKEQDLKNLSGELDRKIAVLSERESKVHRREQEVMNIRQIAADRKVQLETARQNADAAEAARRKAEIEQRLLATEKSRLEDAVTTLIREKRELEQKCEELRSQLKISENLDKAAEAVRSM